MFSIYQSEQKTHTTKKILFAKRFWGILVNEESSLDILDYLNLPSKRVSLHFQVNSNTFFRPEVMSLYVDVYKRVCVGF